MANQYNYIMVLSDGQTFTDITGCTIYKVPADTLPEDIEQKLYYKELPKIAEFDEQNGKPSIEIFNPYVVNVGSGN